MYHLKTRIAVLALLGLCILNTIYAVNPDGTTPLHWAAKYGETDIVEKLLNAGSSIDAKDMMDRTPLHLAVRHPDVVKILIGAGADTDVVDSFGRTPLHEAIRYPETIKLLLAAGADYTALDYMGRTPLDNLIRWKPGRRERLVISMLIDAAAGILSETQASSN